MLEDTLRKYLMDPPAPGPVTMIMVPDEAWAEEERLREDTDLAALDASLTDAGMFYYIFQVYSSVYLPCNFFAILTFRRIPH